MKYKRFMRFEKETILLEAMTSNRSIADICKIHGISPATYYKWKAEIGPTLKPEKIKGIEQRSVIPRLTRREEAVLNEAVKRISHIIARQVASILERERKTRGKS